LVENEKNSPAATRKASCDNDDFIVAAVLIDVEEDDVDLLPALVEDGMIAACKPDLLKSRGEIVADADAADWKSGWTRISTPSNVATTFRRSIFWLVCFGVIDGEAAVVCFCCIVVLVLVVDVG